MGRKKSIRVRKASGTLEDFSIDKFRRSLLRSGASPDKIDLVIDSVTDELGPRTTTQELYRLAHARLRKMSRSCGMRYTLKRALFQLGPTGYPFERYIADLYKNYGYRTKVGITLRGRCVSHEVDVLAEKDDEVAVMECKYHNSKGTTTDVKVAMYVQSRVLDLEDVLRAENPGKNYSGRLVTNTRCTSDALKYATCTGLEVLSWKHPEGRGLEEMIEKRKLYPVTIIYGIQKGLVEKLIKDGILLLRDLLDLDDNYLQSRMDLRPEKARALKARARELCT